jgi:transcriptional regulator with XRE-family HTH domain
MRCDGGLSEEALAVDVGLDRSYVGAIARGEHNLTVMTLLRIANELGVSGSELLKRAGV